MSFQALFHYMAHFKEQYANDDYLAFIICAPTFTPPIYSGKKGEKCDRLFPLFQKNIVIWKIDADKLHRNVKIPRTLVEKGLDSVNSLFGFIFDIVFSFSTL